MGEFEPTQAPGRSLRQAAYLTPDGHRACRGPPQARPQLPSHDLHHGRYHPRSSR
jgi:hypothetical protein